MFQISSIMYPNINAKLDGMYAKKLKRENIEELIKQNSIKQVVALLKSLNGSFRDLDDNAKRINIKIILDNILIQDIKKIYRLLNKKDKRIFYKFISIYEIKCIKSVFRKILSENIINEISNDTENWINNLFKNLRGIEKVKNYEEFLEFIKRTKYYPIFSECYDDAHSKIFEIENKLDKLYFEQIMDIAKSYNSSMEDMIGKKIDLNNILWIYRERKNYNFSDTQIKDTLIKFNYKLKKAELLNLINSETETKFIENLQQTYYSKYIDFGKMDDLEENIDKYLYKLYQKYFRGNIFDIGVVYAYVNMIEAENNDIMNIVEGIRYNLDRNEIRKKLL